MEYIGLGEEVNVTRMKKVIRNVRANFCFIQENTLETVSGDLIRRI